MRIAVVGNSGSGKSTFSSWLARRLQVPLLHVDLLLWMPGWKARPVEEVDARLAAFESGTQWIVDGIGSRDQLERRLKAASHIVLIDPPVSECLLNATKRANDQDATPNEYIGEGLRYREVTELQRQVILEFERSWMPRLRNLSMEKNWIVYQNYSQAYEDERWSVPQ